MTAVIVIDDKIALIPAENLLLDCFDVDFGGELMVQVSKVNGIYKVTNAMNGWGQNCREEYENTKVAILTESTQPSHDVDAMAEEVLSKHFNPNLGFLSMTWEQAKAAMVEMYQLGQASQPQDAAQDDLLSDLHDCYKDAWEDGDEVDRDAEGHPYYYEGMNYERKLNYEKFGKDVEELLLPLLYASQPQDAAPKTEWTNEGIAYPKDGIIGPETWIEDAAPCDAMGHYGGKPLRKGKCPKCGKDWDLSQDAAQVQDGEMSANEYYLRCTWNITCEDRDNWRAQAKALSAIKKGLETSLTDALSSLSAAHEEIKRLRAAMQSFASELKTKGGKP